MPYESKAQRKFMYMCETPKGRAKAHGKCPPINVVKKFTEKHVKRHANGGK